MHWFACNETQSNPLHFYALWYKCLLNCWLYDSGIFTFKSKKWICVHFQTFLPSNATFWKQFWTVPLEMSAFDTPNLIHALILILEKTKYLRNLNVIKQLEWYKAHWTFAHIILNATKTTIRIEYQYNQHSLIINSILLDGEKLCNLSLEAICVQMAFEQCVIRFYCV